MADALHVNGAVDAREARLDQAGLIAPQTSSLAVRTGVMLAPGAAALITGTAATGTMTVAIAAHHWVTSRGTASGPYIGALEAATTVNVAAAPGSGSRIDVVYVKMQDSTAGIPTPDATIGELYGVVTGTVGAGKPALPVGAEELGTVTVAAGATSTNGAGVTIANTARLTAARGAPIPLRSQTEQNALTVFEGLEAFRLDTGRRLIYTGGAWRQLNWRSALYRSTAFSAASYAATNNYDVCTLVIPAQFEPYSVDLHGSMIGTPSVGMDGSLRLVTSLAAPAIGADGLTSGKNSAQPSASFDVPSGASVTCKANLEVLAGSIVTYTDARHSFLEARVFPL